MRNTAKFRLSTGMFKKGKVFMMPAQNALEQIRIKNFSKILEVMRRMGACSLSQITDQLDVGLTPVKKCVEEGVRCGMILSGDTADSTGGRRAQQFLINASYQYFLIIITDNNDFLIRLYDFNRKCVKETRRRFEMARYYESLCEAISPLMERYAVGTICLSIPCVIKGGRIIDWYYNRSMVGRDIRSDLEGRFGVPAIVQNDMKLTVLGVSERSENAASPNLVTAQFGHNGIGVGEMVNGHVLEGAAGFAGEVGHTQDARKNIMGIAYPSKIVRNIIIYLNPDKIIFYRSGRQDHFAEIFQRAVRGIPRAAVPEYAVSDEYHADIRAGLFRLIDQYGYFRRRENEK